MNDDAPKYRFSVEVLETIDDPLDTVRRTLAAKPDLEFSATQSFDNAPDALKRFLSIEVPADRMAEVLSLLEADRSISSVTPEPDAEF